MFTLGEVSQSWSLVLWALVWNGFLKQCQGLQEHQARAVSHLFKRRPVEMFFIFLIGQLSRHLPQEDSGGKILKGYGERNLETNPPG